MEHLFLHCTAMLENQYGIYLSLFMGGLIGSLTHCSFMCSPFILAQISVDKSDRFLTKLKGAALLPYHLGRLTTYMFLGLILSIFSGAMLTSPLRDFLVPFFLFIAGIIFIALAWPRNYMLWKMNIPYISSLIARISASLCGTKDSQTQYILGCVLGFLPCGLVVAALILTLSFNSAIESMVGMMLFGISTIIILLIISFLGQMSFSKAPFLQGNFRKGLMLFNALNLFMIAGLKII